MLALIDGNNFFVSCERVFNPRLWHRPVVVLSNNDGCIISRSNEAKALGVPMGAPLFQWRSFLKHNRVAVLSANFELYGSFSERFMDILRQMCPEVEPYSVDEAFCTLPETVTDFDRYGQQIQELTRRWLGLPVSVGVAPTKTLAKVANHRAKETQQPVFVYRPSHHGSRFLQTIAVGDIWGVGRRLGKKLNADAVQTAAELAAMPQERARKIGGVALARTRLELQGTPCLDVGIRTDGRHSIMVSRSFGKPIQAQSVFCQAVSRYTAMAAAKLRQDHSRCHSITVFVPRDTQRVSSVTAAVDSTQSTTVLVKQAIHLAKALYEEGRSYTKAGVILSDIVSADRASASLFSQEPSDQALHAAVDGLNARFGRHTVFLAAEGVDDSWQSRAWFRSARSLTRWDELPVARALGDDDLATAAGWSRGESNP